MEKTFKPPYLQGFKTKIVEVRAATTDRTGASPTNLVSLVVGGDEQTKIAEIGIKAQGLTADACLLIFIQVDSTILLFDEVEIAETRPSNTVPAFQISKVYDDLILEANNILLVGVTAFDVGGDYINVWGKCGDF